MMLEYLVSANSILTFSLNLLCYILQSNFFAALDDSDNEGKKNAPVATKKTTKKEVVEPSKVENRP